MENQLMPAIDNPRSTTPDVANYLGGHIVDSQMANSPTTGTHKASTIETTTPVCCRTPPKG